MKKARKQMWGGITLKWRPGRLVHSEWVWGGAVGRWVLKSILQIELDVKFGRVQKQLWWSETKNPWMLPLRVISLHLSHLRTTGDLAYFHPPSGIPFSSYSSFLTLSIYFLLIWKGLFISFASLCVFDHLHFENTEFEFRGQQVQQSFYSPPILMVFLFSPQS